MSGAIAKIGEVQLGYYMGPKGTRCVQFTGPDGFVQMPLDDFIKFVESFARWCGGAVLFEPERFRQ